MLDILKIIILSIVQGITEWLPVSSSGHLIIFQKILNFNVSVGFDVALHLGTAFAAFLYFRKDIIKILTKIYKTKESSEEYKTAGYLIIALIPTIIIALLLNSVIDVLFSSLLVVSLTLITTGSVLYLASFFEFKNKVKAFPAFISGIAQGVSVIPGLSRSGLTISSLILSKVKREEAVKFSFILAIPTILGAAFFKIKEILIINPIELLVGFAFSAIVGYASISFLINLMIHKRFRYFPYYCWLMGILLLIFLLI